MAETPAKTKSEQLTEAIAPPAPTETKDLEYVFPDGSKVTGKTQDELLQKAAKRYTDSRGEAEKLKEENAVLRQAAVPAPAPAVATGKFNQQRYWDLMNENPAEAQAYALATWFGYDTTDQMRQVLDGTVKVAQNVVEQNAISGFLNLAPDFPNTSQNADLLTDKMVELGFRNVSTEALLAAHALCLKEGKYEAAIQQPPTAPQTPGLPAPPPPVPQGAAATGGAAPGLEELANTMTKEELRAALEKL